MNEKSKIYRIRIKYDKNIELFKHPYILYKKFK